MNQAHSPAIAERDGTARPKGPSPEAYASLAAPGKGGGSDPEGDGALCLNLHHAINLLILGRVLHLSPPELVAALLVLALGVRRFSGPGGQ